MSAPEVLTFPYGVVDSLPLYYRALAKHLVDTGRAIIEDPPEKRKSA